MLWTLVKRFHLGRLQGQRPKFCPCAACPRVNHQPKPNMNLNLTPASPCSGREAALDMLGVVLQKFPEQLVAQWAEMVS